VKAAVRLRCIILKRLKRVTFVPEQRLRNYHVIRMHGSASNSLENTSFSGMETGDPAGQRRKKG
jgi:hypothetical protein